MRDHYEKVGYFIKVLEDDELVTYEVPESLYNYVLLLENHINHEGSSYIFNKYPERFKNAKNFIQ